MPLTAAAWRCWAPGAAGWCSRAPPTAPGPSPMTLTAVLKRMGRGDLTAHGFRSTFRDWAGETRRIRAR